MILKSLEPLRHHLPDLNTPLGVLRLYLLPVALFVLVTAFFNNVHLAWPFWWFISLIVMTGLGFGLLYQFFRKKPEYKARFGSLAYRQAVSRFGYPGVAIIAAVVTRIRSVPGPRIQLSGWSIVLSLLGWMLIVLGLLLFLRVLQTFGFDNLTMLYVYYPEESRLVDQRMYSILRHPAYASAQMIAMGLALLNGSAYALVCAGFFALSLWGWVRLVEEKELVERFGPSYIEYRQHVPAFYPRLRELKGFFKLLIIGK